MTGTRIAETFSRRATRLVVLGVALALLTQAVVVMTARAQARDLVCGSEFDADVFEGGWTRSAANIVSGSGLLTIPPSGPVDDWAGMPCAVIGPFEIELRARIVSGGQNYVSPFIEGYAADQTVLNIVVLPDGSSSCMAGPASHGWLVESGAKNIGLNEWTGNIPNDVACEGQWMTMRVVVAGGQTAASTRLLDTDAFMPGHAVSSIPGPITQFHLRQPWDAHIEVDYVRLYALDADTSGVVREEGATTRSHVTAEHEQTRGILGTIGSAILSTLDSLKTWLSTQFDGLHDRFDRSDVDHDAILDDTDRVLAQLGQAADTTPLGVALTPGTAPGTWYALVTLGGAPADAEVTADPLAAERMSEGLYRVNASTAPLSTEEQPVVIVARNGTHVGAAVLVVPPGIGGATPTLPTKPEPPEGGEKEEVVILQHEERINATQVAAWENTSVPLASVRGAHREDGRYQLDVGVLGNAPITLSVPSPPGPPGVDQSLVIEVDGQDLTLPGATARLTISYVYEPGLATCGPVAEAACVPQPLGADPLWLAGPGVATALVVRVAFVQEDGTLIADEEVRLPLVGQAIGTLAQVSPP